MMKLAFACISAFFPILGAACDDRRSECEEHIRELVSYRTEAIERAFGNWVDALPVEIRIKFVSSKSAEYERYFGKVAYDPSQQAMIVPRHLISARIPNPIRATAYYWPFYQNQLYRETFPLVVAIDNALWGAYLQEAARANGQSWPHRGCASLDISKRLPCEMLVGGVAERLTTLRDPVYNANRMDRIWPEDFTAFEKRVWQKDDHRYHDVRRYGGLMLIDPLIDKFGVSRVLFYIAQTPFVVEDNNLRASAVRYQERARAALARQPDDVANSATVVRSSSSTGPSTRKNTGAPAIAIRALEDPT